MIVQCSTASQCLGYRVSPLVPRAVADMHLYPDCIDKPAHFQCTDLPLLRPRQHNKASGRVESGPSTARFQDERANHCATNQS
ncbi:hypothetical protein PoB_002878800 [Plakobranchus ocellatus]|uniref:Uncharacterized protein n=1 Tax=Plakobranchus ocellatus TaxID=259542 RepID=A0AAV4A6D7_9GAST|nr:hypothetical protein PoB_002878800 [Plakobranchus ocellatus]